MPNKIQFRRGIKANLPDLSPGEPGLTTDTKELFIGTTDGNIGIATSKHLDDITKQLKLVDGMEYMVHANELCRVNSPVKLIASGDSTTSGDGITDPEYLIHTLCKAELNKHGIKTVTAINGGHSGMRTPQWQTIYLADDLAQNPDLYILRWGLNDGAHTPKSERLQVFTDALRGGLSTMRAAKSVNDMSVVLMMPNSTNDPANGRDAEWFEEIYPVIKQAARDFQCCFVDTYNFLLDSTNVVWEDDIGGDGVHIHPLNIGNAWIVSLLSQVIIPDTLRIPTMTNQLSSDGTKALTDAPSTYPIGDSIFRTDNTFPYDGIVVTSNSQDGVLYQINSGLFAQTTEAVAIRRGLRVTGIPGGIGNNAWAPWINLKNTEAVKTLTLVNSWVNYGVPHMNFGYYKDSADIVHLRGTLKSGTMTAGTVITTLPAGYRPSGDGFYNSSCGAGYARLLIRNNGEVQVSFVSDNSYLSLDGITFKAEA